ETKPYYSEVCAAQLAATYSGGGDYPGIYTTDKGTSACVSTHSGTSAAAPLGAGILALVLSANKNLTYRTIMHLIVETAVPFSLENKENAWHFNDRTKKYFSHFFGFGKLDSYRLVEAAKKRENVGDVREFFFSKGMMPLNKKIEETIDVPNLPELKTLEHVLVKLTLIHPKRGWVVIDLVSPNNVISNLMTKRPADISSEGYKNWTFTTVQHWGEPVKGNWTLIIYNLDDKASDAALVEWHLGFRGESFNFTNSIPENKKMDESSIGAFQIVAIIILIALTLVGFIMYFKKKHFGWRFWHRWVQTNNEYNLVDIGEAKEDLFYKEILGYEDDDEDDKGDNSLSNSNENDETQVISTDLYSKSPLLTEIKVDK
ncbi:pheromone processing endoprotease, partial [Coelomomyces lativittatus]